MYRLFPLFAVVACATTTPSPAGAPEAAPTVAMDPASEPSPLHFVAFAYYAEGGREKMAEFRRKVRPLWDKYGLEHSYSIAVANQGAIVGANPMEQPDEIFVQVAHDPAKFQQYITDPDYLLVKPLREQALRKMTYVMGTGVSLPSEPVTSAPGQRLYGVGLVHYKPGGRAKMDEFTSRASPLFAKHGMHADRFITALDKGAVVGAADDLVLPDEVRIFFVDRPEGLQNYVQDPDYQAIKGIREAGVSDYGTFLGGYLPGPG